MKTVVLASSNTGKILEFKKILPHINFILQTELKIESCLENGLSFVENAMLKARHVAKYTKLPVIADDSGLVVKSLNNAPGIYSSRYSGAGDSANIKKILTKMLNVSDRTAYFYAVVVYLKNYLDAMPIIVDGKWHGEIYHQQKGDNGFGYDAIFYLKQFNKTVAELTADEKNNMSHRAIALNKLKQQLLDE